MTIRWKHALTAAVCVTTLGLAAPAFASLPESSGVSLGMNAGVGFNAKNFGSHFDTISQWLGGSLDLGYKVNMFFEVQAGLIRYPDASFSDKLITGNNAYDFAAKLMMPFDNGVELFAKGGYARVYQKITNSSDGDDGSRSAGTWLGGAGVSMFMDDHYGLTFEGITTGASGSILQQYLATIGLTYIF